MQACLASIEGASSSRTTRRVCGLALEKPRHACVQVDTLRPFSRPSVSRISTRRPAVALENSVGKSTVETEDQSGIIFDWKKQWYPVAVVSDLPTDRPTPVVVLGKDLVVWREKDATWRVFEDKCPHRMVPLSEGRIETDGTLQCAYHGWRFDGSGACTAIPQAQTPEQEKRVTAVPRACATAYPTRIIDGLLFAWLHAGPDAHAESQRLEPNHYEHVEDQRLATPWHIREMPISWDVVVENVTDPAHVPFSHHKVQGNRNQPVKPNFTDIVNMSKLGYQVTSPPEVSMYTGKAFVTVVDIKPPCQYNLSRFLVEDENSDAPGKRFLTINMHIVPVTANSTRTITRFEMDGAIGTPREKMLRNRPIWHDHAERNVIFDGDGVFLARQSQVMRTGLGRNKFYLPTPADLPSIALMRWMAQSAPNGVDFYADVQDPPEVQGGPPPREFVLDRYTQHVKHCKSCSGALENTRRALLAVPFVTAAAFLALAALLGRGAPLLSVPTGVALVVMALSAVAYYKLKEFEEQFTFRDYIHAERD